jgi:hypothetical protein
VARRSGVLGRPVGLRSTTLDNSYYVYQQRKNPASEGFCGFVRSGDALLMSTVPRSGSRARQPGATNLSARFAFTYTWGLVDGGACGRSG